MTFGDRCLIFATTVLVFGCAEHRSQTPSEPAPSEPAARVEQTGRHVEPEGGFSYVIPPDWSVREIAGLLKYKIAFGPPGETYVPNANFQHEDYPGTLDDYVALNIQGLKDAGIDFEILQEPAPVAVDGGLECQRLIVAVEDGDQKLRQTFFFIRHKQRMYVITASVLREGGEQFDELFESLAKSLRIENA